MFIVSDIELFSLAYIDLVPDIKDNNQLTSKGNDNEFCR